MRIFRVVGLLLFPLAALAQLEDSVELKEVVVEGNRLKNFSAGNNIHRMDSTTLQNYASNTLGDFLAQQSLIFVKSAGPGNLATVSMRGTNANHTAVLWNGFNIQSPTLGLSDFSLLPVAASDEIEIQYGGAGALYGSGAVGGAIHLNSPAKFGKGIHAGSTTTFGSFGTYYQSLNFKISGKRFISSVKLFNSEAENNFSFRNTAMAGSPEVKQTNARFRQKGLIFENFFKITARHQINLRVWLQENFRQVPPSMTSPVSLTNISNNVYRISSEWKRSGRKITWAARSAFFSDAMYYNDPQNNLYTKIDFQTSISELESTVALAPNQALNIGINNTYSQAISDGFQDRKNQNRTAVFISYKIKNKKNTLRSVLSIREEYIEGKWVPLTPTLGADAELSKNILLKGNVTRNYRVPTFNDLYWQPGGNPDLKPESGWNEEATVILHQKKSLQNQIGITVFNSNIQNWITWQPGASLYWSPQNVQEVWARGLETNLKLEQNIGKLRIELSGLYNYIVSTKQKTKSENDNSRGKQLIFIPLYSAQGSIALSYRNFYLNYIHSYTGNRFTTSDNTEFIQGYQLGHLVCSKNIQIKRYKLNLNARANNVWNKAYQVVPWQAMPLRYYQLGVSMFFH